VRPGSSQLRTCLRPASNLLRTSFEPVCDQLRAGSSYLDMSRYFEPARSWSQTGSKLVADLSVTSFEPASILCDQLRASFEPVYDQLRTCFKPASNPLRTGLQPASSRFELAGSSYLDMSRYFEPAQSWSQTGSKLVADLSATSFEP